MSTPLAVPASPSPSSKRSRSRDSTRSSAAASVNTPSVTGPSASVPSLIIPSPSQTPSSVEHSPRDSTPYPAFLRQSKSDVHTKFTDLEWEQRKRLLQGTQTTDPQGPPSQWARVSGEIVMNRNRYANVDPYLNNRIRLKVPEGYSDYINASPIVLRNTKSDTVTNFIATQGPKAEITSHIWRMLWHETASPSVIIMLTQTHESGREKCHPYFPPSPSSPTLTVNPHDEFADGFTATVTLLSLTEDDAARCTVRELEMRTPDGDAKIVWHLLFAGWPDFLVPEGADRTALLQLLALSQAKNAAHPESPRVVHCSAGVGRSGTFIALDWLLRELEEGSLDALDAADDPVAEIVDRLRCQRMMMVQGEPQFWFLYDVLREKWRERWRRLHLGIDADAEGEGAGEGVNGEGEEGASAEVEMAEAEAEAEAQAQADDGGEGTS